MRRPPVRLRFAGLVAAAIVAAGWLSESALVTAGAPQGYRSRRLAVYLSGQMVNDKNAQEALMLGVPWKDLVSEFFPRQDVEVSVDYRDSELERDARNRLFDSDRARFLLQRTAMDWRSARLRLTCERNVCHVMEWLRPFLEKIGFVPSKPEEIDKRPEFIWPDEPAMLWLTLEDVRFRK